MADVRALSGGATLARKRKETDMTRHSSTPLRWAFILGVSGLVSGTSPSRAESCGSSPVHPKELRRSDVVATGVLRILDEGGRPQDARTRLISGTAELHAERVDRNRTRLTSPFRFSFQYSMDAACAWGNVVYDGERATVHLKRVAPRATELAAVDIDY
jgi:hypothetical protein